MMEERSISIIVPLYNEASTIDALQERLLPLCDQAEIVFVDGGSTDGTPDKVLPAFSLVRSEKGRGNQMNDGAHASHGDILLFLHADSVLPDQPLQQVRDVMAFRSWGCFGLKFDSHTPWMFGCRLTSNRRARHDGIVFGDQGIFIDRDLFFQAGGFPNIPIMEDFQFSLTLKGMGHHPGMTKRRILTSARRFPWNPIGAYRVMFLMVDLRKRYLAGVAPEELARIYGDAR